MDGFEVFYCFDVDGVAPAMSPLCSSESIRNAFSVPVAELLGRGTFGETWRIRKSADVPYRVAKVIIDPNYPAGRLDREVAGLQRVSSPHVVKLLDHIQIRLPSGNHSVLLFEYVEGGDLAEKLASTSPDVGQVEKFAVALLEAVVAMHAVETVHRDIKPQNIALRDGDFGDPVLLDLGLAKLLDADSMTKYPTLLGTTAFMAPEQVRWEPARKAADVWAVGVILHIMLTGRHPFLGPCSQPKTSDEALDAFSAGPPPMPERVPLPLARAVMTMLSFEPYARGSAARHLRALAPNQ